MHLSIILDPRADVLHAENAAEMAALYHRLLTDAARAGERELKLSAAAADGIPPAQAAHVTLRAIVETLRTLPPRQISAGLAESVKMALTSDADLLDRIERSADLTAGLPEIIARSLTIKKNVVEQDPHEHGLRRVLNFGHTVGHAIESSAGGRLLHGECVALGMLPMCAPALRPRLIRILRKCGLPTEIETTREALLPYLRHDKKGQGAAVTAVEVDEPGSFRFTTMMPEEILHRLEGVLL